MEQYISKSAVKTEIDRLCEEHTSIAYCDDVALVLEDLEEFLDFLEVKEIDLEKEYKNFIKSDNGRSMFETAKHFFELGMRVSNPITAADKLKAQKGE